MTVVYSYEKIFHRPGGNSGEIVSYIRDAFARPGDGFQRARTLAREVSDLILSLDHFQQQGCSAVCPGCKDVCCINRHAYHEHEDLVYLAALGEKMPSYRAGLADTEPCQFLGEYGCSIERNLRPHRCNAYFCTPFLEYINNVPPREHRRFVSNLEQLTRKREDMLEEFYKNARGRAPHLLSSLPLRAQMNESNRP